MVPVILYMDGICLDAHGRLTLTPLNMTLRIFNVATCKRPEAWGKIYSTQIMNFSLLLIQAKLILFTILEIYTTDYKRLYHLLWMLAMAMPTLHGMNCPMQARHGRLR